MQLEGSCHCGAVRFSLLTETPYPYMRCYCSICRKTAGGGGYAINLMGRAETLEIEGGAEITIYRVRRGPGYSDQARSPSRRHFCRHCGSALWASDPRWPELVHPFASAVDTPLPEPPAHVNLMLDHAVGWVEAPDGEGETNYPEYPELSIEEWHRRQGLLEDEPES